MTNEKAREYFSAYSEGTLDAGLAHAFEAKLKADEKLRSEYEQFEATLKELESLRFEQIEVPFDLNDRISAAVDKSIYDKKRSAQPGWALWIRNLAVAGLAAGAVFGAYLSINKTPDQGSPIIGGPVTIPSQKSIEQIEFTKTPNGVSLEYRPTKSQSVTIRGGEAGDEVFNIGSEGRVHELKNAQPDAAAFEVVIQDETPTTIVIVPGTVRKEIEASQGSVVNLAKAIADKYGIPVVLKTAKVQSEISWPALGEADALKASQTGLQNLTGVVPDTRDGVLFISDN